MSPNELDLNEIAAKTVVKLAEKTLKAAGKKLTVHDKRSAKTYAQKIVQRHGIVRVLGMREPLSLKDIYIRVNLLEKPRTLLHLKLEELEEWEKRYKEERKITQERLDALKVVKKHPRLILLGQPGAGKTTFLRYLALQAVKGSLKPERLPVFISLKDWADSEYEKLLDFMTHEFRVCGFSEAQPFIERMLQQGKCLLLLDGLDEASGSQRFGKMQTQIRDFADEYDKNQFVISCRVAAYNHYFTRFSDAEMAEFDEQQVADFIRRWFGKNQPKAKQCLAELEKSENAPIRELTSNPLLLTLICLAFDRTLSFPPRRAELYKDALEALLREWDSSRNIKREEIYQHLTTGRKEDLFSHLAFPWFVADHYFVRQQEAEEGIAAFIRNLPKAREETVAGDSTGVLRAIEAQHGILVQRAHKVYSFAHLSFQEYYSARYLKENPANLEHLLEHLSEKRWREVFLLTSELLSKADNLLLQMQVWANALVAEETKIKKMLAWARDKAASVQAPYQPTATRGFYLALALALFPTRSPAAPSLAIVIARGLDHDFDRDFDRPHDLAHDLDLDLDLYYYSLFLDHADYDRDYDRVLKKNAQQLGLDGLMQELERLKAYRPKSKADPEGWKPWTKDLRQVMITHRNLGHDFGLEQREAELLGDYLYANKLIVDCLQGGCYVTRETRKQILAQLLLPPGEKD